MKRLFVFGFAMVLLGSVAQAEEVLYIGDSHSVFEKNDGTRMGSILAREIAAGHSVAFFAACGSSPLTWVRGGRTACGYRSWSTSDRGSYSMSDPVPTLASLLSAHRPSIVVIEQGDNLFEWVQEPDGLKRSEWPEEAAEAAIRELLSVLDEGAPDARCIWIGPTVGGAGKIYRKTEQALDSLYESLMRTVIPRCDLIDTRKMIPDYRGPDGLHLDGERSRMLGTAIARELVPFLAPEGGFEPKF